MFNDPKWVDLKAEGEFTKREYFGRFCLKPFLTIKERADAVRLSELYYRGINESAEQRMFLTVLAFLKFHIVDTDATWWKDEDGLNMVDENPVYELYKLLQNIQNPKKKEIPDDASQSNP